MASYAQGHEAAESDQLALPADPPHHHQQQQQHQQHHPHHHQPQTQHHHQPQNTTHQSHTASPPPLPSTHTQNTTQAQLFDQVLTSIPAVTAAHHGLQILQNASAAASLTPPTDIAQQYGHSPPAHPAPISPSAANTLAQQYAQSAALQLDDSQFTSIPDHTHDPGQVVSFVDSAAASHKVTRLRRACDMCSSRKVKCDESGPPCKPCADLQVECTFRREMKRRGPPNKHAEAAKAAKRPRRDDESPQAVETFTPITTTNGTVVLDAESIAPWPILQLLVDDFFTYLHPLIPFPHQPSFRQNFNNRSDRTDREFLALLSSMVAVLVASFPRCARAHLKALHSTELFPTAITMIDHCRNIALEARGASLLTKEEPSVDDAATCYFLGLAAGYTLRWTTCTQFMTFTLNICKKLISSTSPGLSSPAGHFSRDMHNGNHAANKPVDHIKDQIGKRIFWVMVAGIRSMTQLGASLQELPLPPPTTQEPYPEQPVEVDDEFIFSDQILPQPEGTISLLTGFNRNVRTYMTMNELIGVEMCYGMNFFDWRAQRNILSNGLVAAKDAIQDLPDELQVHDQVKAESTQLDPAGLDQVGLKYSPPSFPEAQPEHDVRHTVAEQPIRRRKLQYEIQKANIHASHLATRSYFVERYLNLREAHGENAGLKKDERDEMVEAEREVIVQNLLTMLASISQRDLEPNGQSIINKIRQVASTLVQGAMERKGPVAIRADDHLHRFVDILMKLESSGTTAVVGTASGTMGPQEEEEEFRNWSSLKELQLQFLSVNGIPGNN
ncbi:hypothetical protein F5Y18DRAFT_420582 [Xylariaceae sp. FL1019]|nr:hypothetical protein F5Y18DRAFT_420582 [Xylariaceae sp. FL1019]